MGGATACGVEIAIRAIISIWAGYNRTWIEAQVQTRVDKPALPRHLFRLGCDCSVLMIMDNLLSVK
jgi:hypothetical protein